MTKQPKGRLSAPELTAARRRHIGKLVELAVDHRELADHEWERKYAFPRPRWLRDAVVAWELMHGGPDYHGGGRR